MRVIAATNRDLEAMVRSGEFREDLFYRLNVVPHRPAAAARAARGHSAARRALPARLGSEGAQAIEGVSREALDLLLKYSYPGNVRELENIMHRAVVLSRGPLITTADLPLQVGELKAEEPAAEGASLVARMAALERALLTEALTKAGGVQTRAARALGMSERHLRYRLRKHGLGAK